MTQPLETTEQKTFEINTDRARLDATLHPTDNAEGLIVFPDGIGAGKLQSRNWFVAEVMRELGFSTLIVDLLDDSEEPIGESTESPEFDVEILARRLVEALDWIDEHDDLADLPIGLFGASLGATTALLAAARRPDAIDAIVCRGGRPDLAGDELAHIQAPTLLLVGSNDFRVIELNETALEEIGAEQTRMGLISGASHLFAEPGTLQRVADLGGEWFERHVPPRPRSASAGS